MSTIDQPRNDIHSMADEASRALEALDRAATERVHQIDHEIERNGRRLQGIVRGAQIASRQVDAQINELFAEREQLDPTPTDDGSGDDDIPDHAQRSRQDQPPPPDAPDGSTPQVDQPTQPQPALPRPLPPRGTAQVMPSSPMQWILAILLGIVGALIGAVTAHPLFHDISADYYGLVVVIWFVAVTAFGFFLGGWIGASAEAGQPAHVHR